MTKQEAIKEGKKGTLFFRSTGSNMNNESEGKTIQKMLVESLDILSTLLVSIYSQIMASMEMTGREARIPPAKEYLFETSEMKTIKRADMVTFRM